MKKTMIASICAGAAMSVCLALPAFAQDANAKDTHLQAAIDVVEQAGTMPEFEKQLDLIVKNSKIWLVRQNPNAEKDIYEVVDKIAENYKGDRKTMVANAAVAWARYLKEDELKDVLAFFKTDAGQKFASYQPRILGEMIGNIQAYSKERTQVIVAEAIKELNAKGYKFK
nr:DUF2059 domain-containing protein [uncultured Cohaesibacter sp.]